MPFTDMCSFGTILSYRYRTITPKLSMRYPRLLRVRSDLDHCFPLVRCLLVICTRYTCQKWVWRRKPISARRVFFKDTVRERALIPYQLRPNFFRSHVEIIFMCLSRNIWNKNIKSMFFLSANLYCFSWYSYIYIYISGRKHASRETPHLPNHACSLPQKNACIHRYIFCTTET